jgi:hypothetical protein
VFIVEALHAPTFIVPVIAIEHAAGRATAAVAVDDVDGYATMNRPKQVLLILEKLP